ncbi:MAG: hypothetical protein KJ941_01740 [Bacteroidetes bacterium]|nr:hypothetical protein [Bacteroidota bacterium]
MKNLDRRFGNSRSKLWWTFGALVLLIGIASLTYPWKNAEQEKTADNKKTERTFEVTDLYLAEKIDTLQEEPIENNKAIRQLKMEQKAVKSEKETKSNETYDIGTLPTKKVEVANKTTEIDRKRKMKEIYLSTFKLVDYRSIRSRPMIATQQLIVQGTAANKEEKGEVDEEALWRKVDIPYIDYLEKTMDFMEKGSFKNALARLDQILATYNDDINANFYAGFCSYHLKDYHAAAAYFQKTLQHPYSNFDEEAEWYLAKSYAASGDTNKSQEILKSIVSKNGYYAEMARKEM